MKLANLYRSLSLACISARIWLVPLLAGLAWPQIGPSRGVRGRPASARAACGVSRSRGRPSRAYAPGRSGRTSAPAPAVSRSDTGPSKRGEPAAPRRPRPSRRCTYQAGAPSGSHQVHIVIVRGVRLDVQEVIIRPPIEQDDFGQVFQCVIDSAAARTSETPRTRIDATTAPAGPGIRGRSAVPTGAEPPGRRGPGRIPPWRRRPGGAGSLCVADVESFAWISPASSA